MDFSEDELFSAELGVYSPESEIEHYFENAKKWGEEMRAVRQILLETEAVEGYKWEKPCYMDNRKNVVTFLKSNRFFALLFIKGGLIDDPNDHLIQPSINTKISRQMRFTNVQEIEKAKEIIKDFVAQGIAIERKGLKLDDNSSTNIKITREFEEELNQSQELKEAFEKLSAGRRREYAFYIGQGKHKKTRLSRIEKTREKILKGIGLRD